VSETSDTPAKLEMPDVPDTTAGVKGSAKADSPASPNKREAAVPTDQAAKSKTADQASSIDQSAKAATADKPVKAEKAAKSADAGQSAKPAKTDSADQPPKPAKPAPKPKPEDKPFAAFIQENLLPSLSKSLTEREQAPISLELVEGERPVVGGRCWMIQGELPAGRRFWLCFESDAITSGKTIVLAESGSDPSLLESFLIDEKRINQALLESRLLQRLNGQKWFGGN
tara:strand:- start:1305 stop:1988 length:684 start_codon:yes stop_codon:yes gene_type:complete